MAVTAVIAADDLYRFFHTREEETRALRGVSFAAGVGEMVALMGPSGSGKSTLIACLGALDRPDGGQVVLEGKPIARLPEAERTRIRRERIGILMQAGNLLAGLTVAENVGLALRLCGRSDPTVLLAAIASVGLGPRAQALPRELSGGEAARAGLATALAPTPAVLLADEPTAEVDAANEAIVIDRIAEACRRGAVAVVATHSRRVADAASRVITMSDGRIVDDTGSR